MTDAFTEQLKSDNKKLLESNDALQKENKRLLNSNAQISDSINSGKLEIESLNDFKKEVELGIQILKAQNEEMNSLAISVDSELVEKNAKLTELNKQIEAAESKYFVVNKEATQLKITKEEEHYKTMTSYLDEVESKKLEIERLYSRIDELKSNITAIELDRETIKQRSIEAIAVLESTINEKNFAIKALDKENQALEEKIVKNREIFDEINKLKNLSISLTNSKINLEKEISDIAEQLPVLTLQKEEIEKEIETLKKDKRLSEEEYQIAKKKVFAIADKEREINEKEEYVRGKFNEAGLTYE